MGIEEDNDQPSSNVEPDSDLKVCLAKIQRRVIVLEDAQAAAMRAGNVKDVALISNSLARYDEMQFKIQGLLDSERIKNEINIKQTVRERPVIDLSGLSIEELETINSINERMSPSGRLIEHVPQY